MKKHLASCVRRGMARPLRCPPGGLVPASGGCCQRGFAQQHLLHGLHAGVCVCRSKGALGWEVAELEGDQGGTTLPVPSTCHGHSSATSSPRPWHPTLHPPPVPSMLRCRNLGCWRSRVPIPPCLPSSPSRVGAMGLVPGSGVVSSEPMENHWAVAGCRHPASTETMQRVRRRCRGPLDPIPLPRGPAAQDEGPWLIPLACAVWSRGPGTAPAVIGGPRHAPCPPRTRTRTPRTASGGC